ncbi:integrator complex subunit 5-like isoform X2 [Rhopilema esculentum]
MSVVENLHKFLEINGHRDASIYEKSKSAILLLKTLPCATTAVLEQVGEVFCEEAKKYVIEVEKQMLSGQHGFLESNMPESDTLMKEVQKILLGFIECNHDAWAPMIARWSVNLIGVMSSQYGILRALSNLQIDERLELWMNCSACRILMEVAVTCFGYIIDDSPDVCVDYLLGTAVKSSPFFDWAICHMCCCFLDVIPYGILSHALVAFSMQAKDAEIIINCVTRVYNFVLNHHGKVLQNAVLDLFKDSVSAESVEAGSDQEHIDKCTLPFLLHLALHAPRLVDQISEKVTDLLDLKTIIALNKQSNKREAVLQRGLVSRVLDILQNIGKGTSKVLLYLIDSSCYSDETLPRDDAKIYTERKRIASTLLEMLLLHLHENVQNSLHQRKNEEEATEEAVLESPFLKDLQKHMKKLCGELIRSETELRSHLFTRVLSLLCINGGFGISSDAFIFLLIKSKSQTNLSNLLAFQCELEVNNEKILDDIVSTFIDELCSPTSKYTNDQTVNALKNCITIVQTETSGKLESTRMKLKDCLQKHWATMTYLTIEHGDVGHQSLKLLEYINLPPQQSLPQVFTACQNLITTYFSLLSKVLNHSDNDDLWEMVLSSETLLILLVKQNTIVQNTASRQFVETLLMEENIKLVTENFSNADQENSLFPAEPKMQLLDRNNSPDVASRIPVNKSSVVYIGSLNRNKRKQQDETDPGRIVDVGVIQQFLLSTLDSILSLKSLASDKVMGNEKVDPQLANSFSESMILRLQESSLKPPYSFLANLLAEVICPEVTPRMAWPDEEFLKYTIERDIKIKKQFERNPFLWDLLDLISRERPSLCHCTVIVQSLFANCLTYWEVDRKLTVKASPDQLNTTRRILILLRTAGWIPEPWSNSCNFIDFIKPQDVYFLLSGLWRFCKDLNISPQKFSEKYGAKPAIIFSNDQIDGLRRLFRDIFLRNMAALGVFYKQFFHPD